MVKTTPIPLYRNLEGKSLLESSDETFLEYRSRWEQQPLNAEPGEFPLFLDIEVTNLCNLKCSFCATTYFGNNVARGKIRPELVYTILDEGMANGLYGCKFNDRGEPLLHPRLVDFVRHAKSGGLVDVYFNTNAMLLAEDKARALVEAGLDRISISCEGAEKELYEKVRRGASFDKLVENVLGLRTIRDAMGSETPRIRVQSVLIPEVIDRLEAFREFWKDIADEVSVLDFKEESDEDARRVDKQYDWACPQLWQRMTVWQDGTILPCNEDDGGSLALGNAHDMTIKEAWHSPRLQELRAIHQAGNAHTLEACSRCPLRGSQIRLLESE